MDITKEQYTVAMDLLKVFKVSVDSEFRERLVQQNWYN